MDELVINHDKLHICVGDGQKFIQVSIAGTEISYTLQAPIYEIEQQQIGGTQLKFVGKKWEKRLLNGGTELGLQYAFSGRDDVVLTVWVRYFPDSTFIRYRYQLSANKPAILTKKKGRDSISYTGFSKVTYQPVVTEIQFSQYESVVHSFSPNFEVRDIHELAEGCRYPGPITLIENPDHCCILAYEHGAEYPDAYLDFSTSYHDDLLSVVLSAVKGNYYNEQVVEEGHPFVSPWFHFAINRGNKQSILKEYRKFILHYISENQESRKPYIFYNTWNYQERNHYYKGLPYLHSLHQERILKEIDIAHQMGIDVFVIDTGWYNKTGDWIVNDERFPDMLKLVKEKLNSYGMKLGLWFNPIVAAKTSKVFLEHPEFVMNIDGSENFWGKIWETEESYGMCLASGYSNYFIEKLVQLYQELGVTYFKWDAIGQYGCNSSEHNHGTTSNSPQERMECYSYQMGLEMIRIVEEVTRRCPEAIVDFDITEGGRFVGLGFLGVGKYFLTNNGPYFSDFDIPKSFEINPDTINVFFHPGAARARVCRQGVKYDFFVPSILFLAHFLPDSPEFSQWNSLCSLMLGANGIWGDLLELSKEDIQRFGDTLYKYKKVAESITRSYPRNKGFIGASPEIYEKILYEKAEGLVCFFTRAEGDFIHTTEPVNQELFSHIDGADHYEVTPEGRLKITVKLGKNEARPVFVFAK